MKCVHVCWILVGASTRKAFRGSVDWLALVVRWGRSFGQSWAWSARRFVFLLFLENKLLDRELWTDLNNGFHLWWRAMEVSTSFTTTKIFYVQHLQKTISQKLFPRELPSKVFPVGLFEAWLLAHAQFLHILYVMNYYFKVTKNLWPKKVLKPSDIEMKLNWCCFNIYFVLCILS